MENRLICTKNLKLARVKYYSNDRGGAEVSDVDAYVFLCKNGEKYTNPLDCFDEVPVFERVPYSNQTLDGEDFGTRLLHISGELQNGACYIVDPYQIGKVFGKDFISLSELKNYILNSDHFFVDRISIINQIKPFVLRARWIPVYFEDKSKLKELEEYILSHEGAKQYKKV